MSGNPSPLRVAIIGAGPSGFYAAEALLKGREDVSIDLIDSLPTPFGLVRYGVAPDHQKIKSVTRLYDRTCQDPRVRFLGNVRFGPDLGHDEVLRHYHAVIYAVGAPSDRRLGIPGENLPGSLSATEFVAWYNGHPGYTDLDPDLGARSVVVVGVGNVAVDVARILAKSPDELATTDIADHALEKLRESAVEDIYMLGRRGPAQGKFTTKELRELGELENADLVLRPDELEVDPASLASIEGDTVALRNLEVLREFTRQEPQGKPRRLHLRFLVSPVALHGADRLEGVRLERNRLEEQEGGYIAAVGTGDCEDIPAQLLLRSVGYKGTALPGVPFDARKGVIPNDRGRVLDAPGGSPLPGEYVAGWIKRGPTGVIGTNKADAMETVERVLEDALPERAAGALAPERVDDLLAAKGVEVVSYEGWKRLDALEQGTGKMQGRPRVKVTTLPEMLAASRGDGRD